MKELELKQILAEALKSGANFAEIFIEQKESTAISCEDGNIEKINTGIDYGMGIRVISGESTSYVHSNEVTLQNGLQMAQLAGQIAAEQSGNTVQEFQPAQSAQETIIQQHPAQILKPSHPFPAPLPNSWSIPVMLWKKTRPSSLLKL